MNDDKTSVEASGAIDTVRMQSSPKSWMGIWFQGGFAALGGAGLIVFGWFFMDQFSTMQDNHRQDMRETRDMERQERLVLRDELRSINERHWKAIKDLRDEIYSLRHGANRSPSTSGMPVEGSSK